MLTEDLLDEFREQVKDTNKPYLWSNDEILGYAIDAQDLFVRLTGGIPDLTTRGLTDVRVVADAPFASFSPYILRIRSAFLVTAQTPVAIKLESDLSLLRTSDYGLSNSALMLDDDTGTVTAGILGLEEHKVRWYKVPSTSDTCRFHIYRLPYPRITTDQDPLEIDEQHHRALIYRMKELAYDKQDAETYDKGARDYYKLRFEEYCRKATEERKRISYRPRVVQYGGL